MCHPSLRSSNLRTDSSLDSEEISSFSDQPDVVTYVATVQPKPGVFIDKIPHLLVIHTPIRVLSIGISVSLVTGQDGRVHKEIKMYSAEISVSTDVEMTSVTGTADGMISRAAPRMVVYTSCIIKRRKVGLGRGATGQPLRRWGADTFPKINGKI